MSETPKNGHCHVSIHVFALKFNDVKFDERD